MLVIGLIVLGALAGAIMNFAPLFFAISLDLALLVPILLVQRRETDQPDATSERTAWAPGDSASLSATADAGALSGPSPVGVPPTLRAAPVTAAPDRSRRKDPERDANQPCGP